MSALLVPTMSMSPPLAEGRRSLTCQRMATNRRRKICLLQGVAGPYTALAEMSKAKNRTMTSMIRSVFVVGAICTASLAAVAQTPASPAVVEDLNRDVFRAMQYARNSKPVGTWTDKEAIVVKNALVKDGELDAGEKALLQNLLAETFNVVLRARKDPTFQPNDIAVQGKLAAEAKTTLTSLETDLAAATAPRPGESQTAFLVRVRDRGLAKLTSLVVTDEAARAEARGLLAKRLCDVYSQTMAKDPARAAYDLRNAVSTEISMAIATLSSAQQTDYKRLLAEAGVVCAKQSYLAIEHFAPFFSSPAAVAAEAEAIAKRLGLS